MRVKVRQPDAKIRAYIEKTELGIRVTTPAGTVADLEYAGIKKLEVDRCAAGLAICLSETAMKLVLKRCAAQGFKYEYA